MTTPRREHDFNENLEWSKIQATLPLWEEVYRKRFQNIAAIVYVNNNGWAQKAGIDRQIILESGRVYEIDEKCRRKYYPVQDPERCGFKSTAKYFPDVALEVHHAATDGRRTCLAGWKNRNAATISLMESCLFAKSIYSRLSNCNLHGVNTDSVGCPSTA
jgi:hypothetical protein